MFERIMIATDGSKHSERAAEVGIELARLSGGAITVVYVADTGRLSHLPEDMALVSIRDLLVKEGEEATGFIEEMAKRAGVTSAKKVIEGNPGEELVRFADEAGVDAIVIGSCGRSGLEKFLLGSVAEKVVRTSTVPVITVPGEKVCD
ncbi:MAG: universal stress protein [Methanothrix sp.]|jgi:Universal stress protein UspA and related nucleotide-binding proteins|uniref:Universal stress protein n=1 Tax=Methanothrix harundinacea TaxID=301375 RepID=A0A101FUB7_9EURY|nr:MAG: Universal stress protein [Methanothrix harundinacea]MDD2637876.1 universal stress protein [Methanothrix sp.]MDI9400007.1 universal stress protein [Euryarchaeota archaeon]KUK95826.1 MAG: Universal stress protein [Methanothrix harundinacea]MCP1393214.1 universal stress protein [Methanothrix harundinacea]